MLRDRRRLQLAQRNHCLLARQRIWHAHAAFIGALAQGLLDERGRAEKAAAELVAAIELSASSGVSTHTSSLFRSGSNIHIATERHQLGT